MVAVGTMAAVRMEESQATIEGAVTLEFKETDMIYTESFRSASAEAAAGVWINIGRIVRAFSDTLTNSAGKATLAAVSISITDKPQISRAEVVEVLAPETVVPGESATVSIVLLPHWTTAGAERTIQRDVMLEIPADFPVGEARISVAAEGSSSSDFPGEGFGDMEFPGPMPGGGGDDAADKPVPQNLDELIEQMIAGQMDPGLITVTLSPSGGGDDFGAFPMEGNGPPQAMDPFADDGEGGDEDMGPPPTVNAELVIDGFIVTGNRSVTVFVTDEDLGDGSENGADEGPVDFLEE